VTTTIGLLAGALTTGCWLPQLVRSWRTRSTEDLSWLYLMLLSAGVALWTAYGVLNADLAVTLTNAFSLVLLAGLAGIKTLGDRAPREEAPDGSPSSHDPGRSTLHP
jgi:MtN3 and saliva related transmembrane protein